MSDFAMMNRLGNASNPYQGPAKRVLTVCSAGLLRSPTAAHIINQEYGHNTRAVGVVEEYAMIPIDIVQVTWAQEIVCMHEDIAERVRAKFRDVEDKLVVLDIPDMFEYMAPQLVEMIKTQYAEATKENDSNG